MAFVMGFCGFDSIEWPRGYLAAAISMPVDSCSEGRRAIGVLENASLAHTSRELSVSVGSVRNLGIRSRGPRVLPTPQA